MPQENPSRTPGRLFERTATGFVVLALASIFVAGTVNTLWVPLLTGQIGSTVFDGFWTPLLTWLGFIGTAVGIVGRIVVAILRRRAQR